MKVSKTFSFDAAHMLDTHDGKCKNLHGHTYTLIVTVSGDLITDGPKKGMVIDFSDLKAKVKSEIIDRLDHAYLYDQTNAQERELAEVLERQGKKTFAFKQRTTAENLTIYVYRCLRDAGLDVSNVRLYETPNSFCEYGE
ncbi:6-carboxytetrahydropterin synthase QueD [Basilea psittacipulmonis]|uniref:6-carboxy-5,6,7,8-tetrahydropterin synthase n=1 Tax=Basilea psittacipulmonis DSM 24701 TaxID=1072685 RepID=A0A077DEX7_9BURK|nr:6-carboxytetrahydropterin synthase QueD [Basilea psittacipulmonis]AIL33309.1 6-carboxy-5,6,7,8-tetrahydropterin synthase [Basilea psittacipulmonis DSM 24701]